MKVLHDVVFVIPKCVRIAASYPIEVLTQNSYASICVEITCIAREVYNVINVVGSDCMSEVA